MKKRERILRVNGDILTIVNICNEIGWNSLKELSIYRIVYIASVLYKFKYPDKENPFSVDYNFVTSLRGPYTEDIKTSLTYLLVNDYLNKKENEIVSGSMEFPNVEKLPNYYEKSNWLRIVIYILAIYGEEKIYDFVVRDPQYQDNLQSNSIKEINTEKGNKTYQSLIELKRVFEESLGEEARNLDDKKYLDYYFDYVFSKILRGEIDNGF
ncbi:hypothetical protein QCQ72_005997 [Bacillus cereus]|nr:hypothetical protein [Bacillus cereus]